MFSIDPDIANCFYIILFALKRAVVFLPLVQVINFKSQVLQVLQLIQVYHLYDIGSSGDIM